MFPAPEPLPLSDDVFSHQTLELSVELIRPNNPGLASAIKKAITQISPTNGDTKAFIGNRYCNAQLLEALPAHTIGKIVSALTELGQHALQNQNLSLEYLNALRHLINDWVQLTEWILKNSINAKTVQH